MFSCGISEFFKNTYFEEHLRTNTSESFITEVAQCLKYASVAEYIVLLTRTIFNMIFQVLLLASTPFQTPPPDISRTSMSSTFNQRWANGAFLYPLKTTICGKLFAFNYHLRCSSFAL